MKGTRGASIIAALGLALTFGVSGCSKVLTYQPPAPSPTQSSATDLPANHKWVAVPTQGVVVAVPQTWVEYSSQDTPEDLAIAAKALGISVKELKASLSQEMLMQVRAPSPDPSNINATVVDLDHMPTTDELTSQLEGAGALGVAVRPVRTDAGDAVVAYYQQHLTTGKLIYGAGLFIDRGDSLLNLTVTSPHRATITERMNVLITNVHRT